MYSFSYFNSVQLPSRVQLFATPWIAACQASLSITSREEIPHVQCKRNPSKMVDVVRGHQKADTLKPYSQKTSQSNHTRTTAFSNSMKLSHAQWGHPRQTGHGGEFWQNVVHWRREYQTTSLFLPWEPHEQYEKQKDRTLKEELPRSVGAQYATGDQWRNNTRKNEEMEPKQKQRPVVDVTGDGRKVWCWKEYCVGTWNVSFMIQGILEVVKQEMARVNIDILEISELKWTGMGKFNSDDHYIYYCGQEFLRRNAVAS